MPLSLSLSDTTAYQPLHTLAWRLTRALVEHEGTRVVDAVHSLQTEGRV
jgi:hypothetical protein